MSYSQGGLIQASDYNGFVGGSSANVSGQLNTVWSTGYGNAGYGQTAVSNVTAVSDTVTATQWATLINRLNSIRTHQTGSGSGISAVVAGDTVTYLSTLSTALTSSYTDRLTFASSGSTSTGSNFTWNPTAASSAALSTSTDRTVTFASADAARYFFNAGGRLTFVVSATDNAGTSRSQSVRDLVNNMGGIATFGGYTNGGRSGSGGTISVNNTSWGYWTNVYNTATTVVEATDVSPYASDYTRIQCFASSSDTTNGANGLALVFRVVLYSAADDVWDNAINLTVTTRVDVVYPETTNLSNSWGTPTIS